jgi:hypothetical protein
MRTAGHNHTPHTSHTHTHHTHTYTHIHTHAHRKKEPRCRWDDNINMKLQEVGFGIWTGSSWLRIGAGGGHF